MTHSSRRARLTAALGAADLDAMLVTDLINVRYLSGFTGSAGALLVYADERPAVLATDGRYRTQAARQAPDLQVAIERTGARHLLIQAAAAGARRVGFEAHVMTVDGFDALSAAMQAEAAVADADSPVELVRASNTVETLREVKDAGEVALPAWRPTQPWVTWWNAAACGRGGPNVRSAGSWKR